MIAEGLMARKDKNRCSPEELLVGLSPQVRQLAEQLRELIREVVPDVEETGYPGWKLIGYRHGRYFGFIAPKADHIQLGFEHGATLPDPAGLLEGAGKQVRYVALRPEKALQIEPLKELIQTAALRALLD
jgi:hypothetical protein